MLSNSREDNVLSLTELSLDDNELKISEYFFGRMLNDTNESTCEDIDDVAEFQLVPKIVNGVLLGIGLIYVLGCYMLYLRAVKKTQLLYQRNQVLVGCYVAGVLFSFTPLLTPFFQRELISCLYTIYFPFGLLGLLGGALQIRVLLLYLKVNRNRMITVEKVFKVVVPRERLLKQYFQDRIDTSISYNITMKSSRHQSEGQAPVQHTLARKKVSKASSRFKWMTFLISNKFTFPLFLMRLLIITGVFTGLYYDQATCLGCTFGVEASFLPAFAATDLLLVIAAFISVRNEPDPLGVKKEIGLAMIFHIIPFIVAMALQEIDPLNLSAEGKFDWMSILILGSLSGFYFVIPRQLLKSMSERKGRLKSFVTSTDNFLGQETLDDILQNKTALSLFKIHLADEFSYENFQFYESIIYWKDNFDSLTPKKLERFCEGIKTIYLIKGAELELNLSDSVRRTTLTNIREKKFEQDLFDLAYFEIRYLLEQDSFRRFKKSKRYKRWKNKNKLELSDIQLEYAEM